MHRLYITCKGTVCAFYKPGSLDDRALGVTVFVPVAVHERNVILKPDCGMHYSNTIDLPTHCTMFSSHAD